MLCNKCVIRIWILNGSLSKPYSTAPGEDCRKVISSHEECTCYHLRRWVGKGFTHVCLSVCLSLFPGDNFWTDWPHIWYVSRSLQYLDHVWVPNKQHYNMGMESGAHFRAPEVFGFSWLNMHSPSFLTPSFFSDCLSVQNVDNILFFMLLYLSKLSFPYPESKTVWEQKKQKNWNSQSNLRIQFISFVKLWKGTCIKSTLIIMYRFETMLRWNRWHWLNARKIKPSYFNWWLFQPPYSNLDF